MAEIEQEHEVGERLTSTEHDTITLVKYIGSGGFGEVWKVKYESRNEFVAVKFLRKNALLTYRKSTQDEIRSRFLDEWRRGIGLSHANIIEVYFLGETDVPYIGMQLCEYDLLEYARNRDLSEKDRFLLIEGIIDGLDYLHQNGIIHRDLRPENVLLLNNIPKLSDFGIAKWGDFMKQGTGITLTYTGERMGALEYMSPEQKRDSKHVDSRTDFYSLGVLIYELCTGERLISDEIAQDRGQKRATIDRGFEFEGVGIIFLKLTQYNPINRYSNVQGIREDLNIYKLRAKMARRKVESEGRWSTNRAVSVRNLLLFTCQKCGKGPIVDYDISPRVPKYWSCISCGSFRPNVTVRAAVG